MTADRPAPGPLPGLRGALMVCGTNSDAGKSRVVTGLCRALARRGVRVAPFKAQNMALNSYVTRSGHEIGRAQGVQALAAGVEPEVDMNPILLKPSSDRTSQVIVEGVPAGHLDAVAYHAAKPALRATVLGALDRLRARFDVVLLEGAGSPAEINLLDGDLVNLWLAHAAGLPAVVVGDIDRGGVFASLYGTVALLPDHLRSCVKAFVINKFRGDPALLAPGLADLEARTGVPTLGVLPWVDGLHLDAEDSLALRRPWGSGDGDTGPADGDRHTGGILDAAVVRFPRISNFTDVDALGVEPGVGVRWVTRPAELGDPDLVILPGTKATVADLAWLRSQGLDAALAALPPSTTVLGICGGYQMLGRSIDDGVESGEGTVAGLGRLPVTTRFETTKVTRPRRGRALDRAVTGYQIHHGRTASQAPWVELHDEWGADAEGATSADGAVIGTSLHGLFESDAFRTAFVGAVAARRGKAFRASEVSFGAAREAQFDRLADLVEAHLDMAAIEDLVAAGVPADASGERPARRAADCAARPPADRSPLAVPVPNPEYP
ncbi:MAG: adenosylcobyric acid synthase [Actinomycetota bacterium]|nr:adenosylcobyric acid synthase [Actinomycetota bacterium]